MLQMYKKPLKDVEDIPIIDRQITTLSLTIASSSSNGFLNHRLTHKIYFRKIESVSEFYERKTRARVTKSNFSHTFPATYGMDE